VGGKPDFSEPVVLSADRGGVTVEHMCNQIHRSLGLTLAYALVWGTSSKHYPQRSSPPPLHHYPPLTPLVPKKVLGCVSVERVCGSSYSAMKPCHHEEYCACRTLLCLLVPAPLPYWRAGAKGSDWPAKVMVTCSFLNFIFKRDGMHRP